MHCSFLIDYLSKPAFSLCNCHVYLALRLLPELYQLPLGLKVSSSVVVCDLQVIGGQLILYHQLLCQHDLLLLRTTSYYLTWVKWLIRLLC
jgi:hypothetical protein